MEDLRHHAPSGYTCPFCLLAAGVFDERVWVGPEDVVYSDELAMAFIAPAQFSCREEYPGHVMIVPRRHIENIYTLPDSLAAHIAGLARRVALALRESCGCQGTSTRQHNEPAGNQDVFHYHLHVFPRWMHDGLYTFGRPVRVPDALRQAQAKALIPALTAVLKQVPLTYP